MIGVRTKTLFKSYEPACKLVPLARIFHSQDEGRARFLLKLLV